MRVRNSGRLVAYGAGLARVLVLAAPKSAGTGSYTPLKLEVWEEHIEVRITDVYPNEEINIMSIDSRFLDDYLGKVFEVCYSTPLPPSPLQECTRVTLKKTETMVGITSIDARSSF